MDIAFDNKKMKVERRNLFVDTHPFTGLFACDPSISIGQADEAYYILSMGRSDTCPTMELLDDCARIWRYALEDAGYGKRTVIAFEPSDDGIENAEEHWSHVRKNTRCGIDSMIEALHEEVPLEDILA